MRLMAGPGRPHTGAPGRLPRGLAAAGMHLGLLTVCFSAVFTGWQRSIVTLPQWGVILLVAAALLAAGCWGGGRLLGRTPTRLLLTLAGLMALGLCYEPQLAASPWIAERLPEAVLSAQPGIALVGTTVLLLSWLAYLGARGERAGAWPQFRVAAGVATGLVLATSAFTYMLLHPAMGWPAAEALRPVLCLAQAGVVCIVLAGTSGAPGIRMGPHIYLGLTLILAFARNLLFPME